MTTAQDNKNNTQYVNDWSASKAVSTHRLGKNEALSQHVATATLEHLIKAGYQAATWNAVSDAEWDAQKAIVKAQVALTKDLSVLTSDDLEAAFNLGANYFEHGHAFIMNGTPVEDRVTMTKA